LIFLITPSTQSPAHKAARLFGDKFAEIWANFCSTDGNASSSFTQQSQLGRDATILDMGALNIAERGAADMFCTQTMPTE
jgi:hypothetical protein